MKRVGDMGSPYDNPHMAMKKGAEFLFTNKEK